MRPPVTELRKAILEIVENSDTPMMAKAVHEKMNKKPDLSTVYRALEYFLNEKRLIKIYLNNKGQFFYSSRKSPGHFIICKQCSLIVSFDSCPAKSIENEIENQFGFTISDHILQFVGLCKTCSRSVNKG